MPRYIARRPIHIGGALAFAAGAQVPASHVDRFDLLDDGIDGPAVVEVGDDVVGDRPDLADGLPDTTPETVSIGQRLLYGDPDTSEADGKDEPATGGMVETSDAPTPKSSTKSLPATGTTTSTVTEG